MQLNLFIRFFHFLFNKKKYKPVLIVFVGDLVLETLHTHYRKWIKKCDLCYIHTDMGQLPLYKQYASLKCLYIGNITKNDCGKRDFDSGRKYFEDAKESIRNLLNPNKYNKIILISALRYSSACGISTELFIELKQSMNDVHFIGLKPLFLDGPNAINNFNQALSMINSINSDKIILIGPNAFPANMNFTDFITNKIAELVDKQIK